MDPATDAPELPDVPDAQDETRHRIEFNRACTTGREEGYVAAAIARGRLSAGGPHSDECVRLLEEAHGEGRVLLTSSCTHALELAALLMRLVPGDEVLVPAFAYVTTAGAFALHGGRPVFVDVLPDTLDIDPADVARKITKRTRAVVALHYAGIAADMEPLLGLAKDHGLLLVEDNAHGLFGRWRGSYLGTLGTFGAVSFHDTKPFTSGEGGALVVNDPAYARRARVLRDKGTNQVDFSAGIVPSYTWVDRGSHYAMSELQAAVLRGQLERRESILARRRKIWERYRRELSAWARRQGVTCANPAPEIEHTGAIFWLLLPDASDRGRFIEHLSARGIEAAFHYQPLHLSPAGRELGGREGDCPVSEAVSARLVRLPMNESLTDRDQARVIEAALDFGFGS